MSESLPRVGKGRGLSRPGGLAGLAEGESEWAGGRGASWAAELADAREMGQWGAAGLLALLSAWAWAIGEKRRVAGWANRNGRKKRGMMGRR